MGLTEPKMLNYMTLEDQVTEYNYDQTGQNGTSILFTLGSRITREKRIVYDSFMMLGDVGGLSDFFYLALTSAIGVFSERFYNAKMVSKLFRENPSRNERPGSVYYAEKQQTSKPTKYRPLSFNSSFICFQSVLPECFSYKKRRAKVLHNSLKKLDKQLDVVGHLKRSQALNVLLRLLLSKYERKLLQNQRRSTVAEKSNSSSSSSNSDVKSLARRTQSKRNEDIPC